MWNMKVTICPPLHELWTLLLVVLLWHWQLLNNSPTLAMHLAKHPNMQPMMQLFVLAFKRWVWRPHSLPYAKSTLTKKSGKGRFEWKIMCFNVRFSHQKLKALMKTKFVNKVILFQETLKYQDVVNLCYGKQKMVEFVKLHIPNTHIWAICKAITETWFPLWSNISSTKLEDISCYPMLWMLPFH
jgi:hypothetical protein